VWRELWAGLGRWRGRSNTGQGTHSSAVAPIGLIITVAIVCIVVAVKSSARRADEVALQQERNLFANAVTEHRDEAMRDAESTVSSSDAVDRIWLAPDPDWIHRRVGLRLKSCCGVDVVIVLDPSDQMIYGLAGQRRVAAEWFGATRDDLKPVIDAVRGRTAPSNAPHADPRAPAAAAPRAAQVQTFMGRPVIATAVAVGAADGDIALPGGLPPLLITVSPLQGRFIEEASTRLDLPDLRMVGPEGAAPGDNQLSLSDDHGRAIGRFAWTPNRPGAEIFRNVMPFLGVAFGAFFLLAAFVLRYMRRTEATIAASETQMRHLAMHDPLSGLPNRTYFGEHLAALIEEVRGKGGRAAVLSIDLDRFKDVNDTLGHLVGDALIGAVAQRLVRVLRSNDLVARLGGDEFAVLSPDIQSLPALVAIADRIIEALRAPFTIMGHTIVIGTSIGIALIERHSGEASDIMRWADVALYRAKNDGRNRACIYDADMDADLRERKQLEQDLREAIANNGLSLAFQPLVNPSGDIIIGVEALCRWRHPQRGNIPPVEFIPIAEHSELIVALGEWVLREACREAIAWPDLSLAVNVSPLQFRRPDFVDVVERILAETGFDPTRLELELTESTLIGNVESAGVAMRRLKALGVRLALDDFGTGYSSLLYLRTFPFDKLKIDRSFVSNIESAADAAAIVHAVVSLGRGLGMKVTAEGVETAEQHLFLRAAGVHSIQGYRFGRPAPAAAIAAALARQLGTGRMGGTVTALAG
jgi:diguanylate cyclase